jgi:hypothetical protein
LKAHLVNAAHPTFSGTTYVGVAVTLSGCSCIKPLEVLLPAVLLLLLAFLLLLPAVLLPAGALLLVCRLPLLKPVTLAAVAAKACRMALGSVGLGSGGGELNPAHCKQQWQRCTITCNLVYGHVQLQEVRQPKCIGVMLHMCCTVMLTQ